MARAIADIIKEISAGYNPIKDSYNKQLQELDPQQELDIKGLEQAKTNAFGEITTGANRRGMFYSGMPLEEQAKYTGSEYLPSLASLKSRYAGIRGNLREALAGVDRDMYNRAQDLRQQELDREAQLEAARQAAASAGGGGSGGINFGGGSYSTSPSGGGGGNTYYEQRSDKGFNFRVGGQPVSAYAYAQATGTPFRTLLQQMAASGDTGAKTALNWIGNDGGYDPNKNVNGGLYTALTGNRFNGLSNSTLLGATPSSGVLSTGGLSTAGGVLRLK